MWFELSPALTFLGVVMAAGLYAAGFIHGSYPIKRSRPHA
jgi:hypothetical protein